MLKDVIYIIIGFILVVLGLLSGPSVQGGAPTRDADTLTEAAYRAEVFVTRWSLKWANGDLSRKYPECPFISGGQFYPKAVKYAQRDLLSQELPLRHWGQRKLLLTEIDFLNRKRERGSAIAVYAGAADGRHIPLLVEMYPEIEFHLYDPRPFHKSLDGHRNIRLNPYYGGAVNRGRSDQRTEVELRDQRGWFTDEVAAWYQCDGADSGRLIDHAKKPRRCPTLYFISDIRTVPTEPEVEKNQREQERWIRTMRPQRSMVKFRVPYPHVGETRRYRYLQGAVRLQCWAPIKSAETRLIVDLRDNFAEQEWDTVRHERNCSWYNHVMRTHDFSTTPLRRVGIPIEGTLRDFWTYVPGDTPLGFDFVYELQILRDFLAYRRETCTEAALRRWVEQINGTLISRGSEFINYLKK